MVALLCVAQFVIVLDVTIVAIALPALQADLGFSTAALGWVVSVYTLVFGGSLVAAGRLADRIGRRRAFVAGLSLFALASLGCGLAPSAGALLAARGAQGLGAALVAPAALALLTAARPDGPARGRALGWWTAAAAGGGASGWLLGGLLTALEWRLVFLVTVPVCAAAAALAPRVLPAGRQHRAAPVNAPAALLATTGVGALVLALTLAQQRGPGAPPTLVALAAAVVLLGALAALELRAGDPLLDRRLLRRPAVRGANGVAAALTATTTPPMFLCTLYAQRALGLPPALAGLLFPPFNLAVIAGSLSGPRLAAAVGERAAMAGGLLGVAAGGAGLLTLGPRPLPSLLAGFVALGAGLGVASVASTARGTAAVDGAHQGLAAGLLNTSAQLGTALGLALIVPLAVAHGFHAGFALAAALAAAAGLAVVVRGPAERKREGLPSVQAPHRS
jgi:MFS family permease